MREQTSVASQWGWAAAAVVLAVALAIDLWDGPLLKVATSGLLLAAGLIMAVTRAPRSRGIIFAAAALAIFAAALIGYRLLGPGL